MDEKKKPYRNLLAWTNVADNNPDPFITATDLKCSMVSCTTPKNLIILSKKSFFALIMELVKY